VDTQKKHDILKRPEFVLTEANYKNYIVEGVYPDNVVIDGDGVEWMPCRDRQVPKKMRFSIKKAV